MEELFRQPWPVLARSVAGSDPLVAPSPARVLVAADSSSPVARKVAQAHSKANAAAAPPAKRNSPDHAAASTVSAATSSKKQKLSLTCTVCGITANSEKAMQDHLNGKGHRRKAATLAAQPIPPEPEQEHEAEVEEKKDAAGAATAPSGDYTPKKLLMVTNAGALNEVTQMDGYLLCEACNVRTADRVTMMCHLEGSKHISKAQKKRRVSGEAPAPAPAPAAKKRVKGVAAPVAVPSVVTGGDPDTEVLEVDGVARTVRRMGGFLLCERCDVKAPSEAGMRSHLSGKKHKSKANTSSDVAVNVSAGGEGAGKAQAVDKDTAAVADTAAQVEASVAMPLQAKVGDLQEITTTLEEVVVATTGDDSSLTLRNEVMKDSATAVAAEANAVGESDSLIMGVDGVRHPLRRVEGFLVCPCCNVKAPFEIVMRSHLAGKKHKQKMTLADTNVDVGAPVNKKNESVVATSADQVNGNSSNTAKADGEAESEPLTTPQAKNAAAVVPMEVDEPEKVLPIIEAPKETGIVQEAEGEQAADKANCSVTQVKESVETGGNPAPGKPVKIQVEGVVFTVLQQENGTLSCVPCGIQGCDKDGMLQHLYTKAHWDKARLADEEEECTAAVVNKVGDGGDPASEGTAQVEN